MMGAVEALLKAAFAELGSYGATERYAADMWGGSVEEFREQVDQEEMNRTRWHQ
jgi:hypothetical protein